MSRPLTRHEVEQLFRAARAVPISADIEYGVRWWISRHGHKFPVDHRRKTYTETYARSMLRYCQVPEAEWDARILAARSNDVD